MRLEAKHHHISLEAKPYKCRCYSSQPARLFGVVGKDYFMLHKILCGFIIVHSPFDITVLW